jgi:hypothetical protein
MQFSDHLRKSGLSGVLLLTALTSAQAAPVLYTFSTPFGLNFTYTAPDFITTDTNILAANLGSCTPGFHAVPVVSFTCDSVSLIPSELTADRIDFFRTQIFLPDRTSTPVTDSYRFPDGSFGAAGSYDAFIDVPTFTAHLDVAVVDATVPEPGSLELLGIGAAALWWRRRSPRRNAAR